MTVEWIFDTEPVDHSELVRFTERMHAEIRDGSRSGCIRVSEHPHIYTYGLNTPDRGVFKPSLSIPVYPSGRPGSWTYHGPGQKVVNINMRITGDYATFRSKLDSWMINTTHRLGVEGVMRDGERYGVWVPRPDRGDGFEDKIISSGVRVTRDVCYYGFSVNVTTDLSYYDGIKLCSVSDSRYGVTSFRDLGVEVSDEDFATALKEEFDAAYGV